MSPVAITFYSLVVLAFIVALGNWRSGTFLLIAFALLRDPIRKLDDSHSVLVTLSVNALWLAIYIGIYNENAHDLFKVFRRWPQFRRIVDLVLLALLPGVLIAIVSYDKGILLAIAGIIVYFAPFVGIAFGYLMVRREQELWNILSFFVVIHTIGASSVFFEYAGVESPVFGGIDFDWIRYTGGGVVDLMTGVYRSPDVMGFHAAHVVMFCLLLLSRPRGTNKWFWVICLLVAFAALLLAGRRKMLAMPILFLVVSLYMQSRTKVAFNSWMQTVGTICVLLCASGIFAISQGWIGADYAEYAGTLATEGADRTQGSLLVAPVETLRQAGLLGHGIGVATQGSYYFGVDLGEVRTWQEDGISRLFVELGVFGVIFIVYAGILLLRLIFQAVDGTIRQPSVLILMGGLFGVILANGASFVISHQAYSGDPCAILLVASLIGVVLSAPSEPGFASRRGL